jgi:hypothetical protein
MRQRATSDASNRSVFRPDDSVSSRQHDPIVQRLTNGTMTTALFVGFLSSSEKLATPGGGSGHSSPSHQCKRQKAKQDDVNQRNQHLLADGHDSLARKPAEQIRASSLALHDGSTRASLVKSHIGIQENKLRIFCLLSQLIAGKLLAAPSSRDGCSFQQSNVRMLLRITLPRSRLCRPGFHRPAHTIRRIRLRWPARNPGVGPIRNALRCERVSARRNVALLFVSAATGAGCLV